MCVFVWNWPMRSSPSGLGEMLKGALRRRQRQVERWRRARALILSFCNQKAVVIYLCAILHLFYFTKALQSSLYHCWDGYKGVEGIKLLPSQSTIGLFLLNIISPYSTPTDKENRLSPTAILQPLYKIYKSSKLTPLIIALIILQFKYTNHNNGCQPIRFRPKTSGSRASDLLSNAKMLVTPRSKPMDISPSPGRIP